MTYGSYRLGFELLARRSLMQRDAFDLEEIDEEEFVAVLNVNIDPRLQHTEAHHRHGSTTPSGNILELQRRVWPVWRHDVARSLLLHTATPLLQAVGLVLAVRLRLPRGGIVGVPG